MKAQNMKIELKDGAIGATIEFRVVKDYRNLPDWAPALNWFKIQKATWCLVVVTAPVYKEALLGKGLAFCSKKDAYDPEVGRRIALKRAMKDFPRAARVWTWGGYSRYATEHRMVLEETREKAQVPVKAATLILEQAQKKSDRLLARMIHRASKVKKQKQPAAKQASV